MLLQSTVERLDFKAWVFITYVFGDLCHMAHWGDAAKVFVLIPRLYLCSTESLCLNASGLWVTVQAFAFRKKSRIQRQRRSLKLCRAPGWVLSESKPQAPFSSGSPLISLYGWSRGLKGPPVIQRGRLLDGKRLRELCFNGSVFELRKPSLPKLPILPH